MKLDITTGQTIMCLIVGLSDRIIEIIEILTLVAHCVTVHILTDLTVRPQCE